MTPAEAVVAQTVLQVRKDMACGIIPTGAIKPIVQRRTGAGEGLYWRSVRIANEADE